MYREMGWPDMVLISANNQRMRRNKPYKEGKNILGGNSMYNCPEAGKGLAEKGKNRIKKGEDGI